MKNTVKSVVFAAALAATLGGLCVRPLDAEQVVCPVEADTFILHGSMANSGYPDANAMKIISVVGCETLVRFDLSDITDSNGDGLVNGTDVAAARFRFYTHDCSGMMCIPMAPAGTTQTANVAPLNVWSDPDNHGGHVLWTESTWEDEGYVNGLNDPGDVAGVDPVICSYSQGPGHWGEVDVTGFVRDWLDGLYANNGIRLSGNEDDRGWYWSSKDYDGPDAGGSGDPALSHHLVVDDVVPGDANGDYKVDGADLALWQQNYDPLGLNSDNNTWEMGNWNHDGKIDGADLALWQQNYNPLGGDVGGLNAVPEPGTAALLAVGGLLAAAARRRRG